MKRVRNSADFLKARKHMGMSQTQMAEALRITGTNVKMTINRWETGKLQGGLPGPVGVAMESLLTGFRPTGYKGTK